MSILRYSCRILLLVIPIVANAQSKYLPTQVKVGADVSNLIRTFTTSGLSNYEVNADIDFHKYLLSFDYGVYDITRNEESFSYKNSGSYFRIGPDANFISDDPEQHAIFFGIRYCRSFFNDQLNYVDESPLFGEILFNEQNKKIRGRWFEFNAGMKVRVFDNVFLGYTFRYKFSSKLKGNDNFASYDFPGYGPAQEKKNFTFNYHVFYQIPLRKRPLPEDIKK